MCRSKVNSDIFLSHTKIKVVVNQNLWSEVSIKFIRTIMIKNQCHLKEILCIIRLWDEVVDELGKEPCKYRLLRKFTSVTYDRGGNGKKGILLWHYNISNTKLRNCCQVTQTFLPCSTRLSLSVNAWGWFCELLRPIKIIPSLRLLSCWPPSVTL